MMIVNKPDLLADVQCYKCGAVWVMHPSANMNDAFVTDCNLHKSKCEHEWIGNASNITHCKKCGEFYK